MVPEDDPQLHAFIDDCCELKLQADEVERLHLDRPDILLELRSAQDAYGVFYAAKDANGTYGATRMTGTIPAVSHLRADILSMQLANSLSAAGVRISALALTKIKTSADSPTSRAALGAQCLPGSPKCACLQKIRRDKTGSPSGKVRGRRYKCIHPPAASSQRNLMPYAGEREPVAQVRRAVRSRLGAGPVEISGARSAVRSAIVCKQAGGQAPDLVYRGRTSWSECGPPTPV